MTIILFAHIVFMTASLAATFLMVGSALLARTIKPILIKTNLFVTVTGILCGILMLFNQPIGAKCAVLLTYSVMFTAAYVYTVKQNQSLSRSAS